MKASGAGIIICIISFLSPSAIFAQWEYGGKSLCDGNWSTHRLDSSPDGEGGILVAWGDDREGFHEDVYVQKVDSAGYEIWTHNGVNAAVDTNVQFLPQVVSDGAGGAIVAWNDFGRSGGTTDIYAQRIDSSGRRMWGETGMNVVRRNGHQGLEDMVSDGQGGAIMSWWDDHLYPADTIPVVVQRIDRSGILHFGEYGLNATVLRYGTQMYSQLVMTTDSNFVVTFFDSRPGGGVFAQKFNLHGEWLWDQGGIPVALQPANANEERFGLSAAPGGGIYALWDNLTGDTDVAMQWVDGEGQARWGEAGMEIAGEGSGLSTLTTGLDGRAIIGWIQAFSSYVNIIDTAGTFEWTNPLELLTSVNHLYGLTQSTLGEFEISAEKTDMDCHARAIKYSLEEGFVWGDTGVCFSCVYPERFSCPTYKPQMLSDLVGGVYMCWKTGDRSHVILNRVYADGWVAPDTTTGIDDQSPLPEGPIEIISYPNPFNSSTVLTLMGYNGNDIKINIYDLSGRLVRSLDTTEGRATWDATDNSGKKVSSGTYFARIAGSQSSSAVKLVYLK